MKRIAYHPDLHPALPWCVNETSVERGINISHFPALALFATKSAAQAAYPDATVDEEFAWECQLQIAAGKGDEAT